MSLHRTTVAVYDGDPLSRVGLISCLQQQADIVVFEGPVPDAGTGGDTGSATGTGPGAADVAVMIVDGIDARSAARLRQLVLDLERRVVLVTDELDEEQLRLVLDAGVQTVVWRRQATPERLVRAVRATARGEGEIPPDLLSRLLAQIGRMRHGESRSRGAGAVLSEREVGVLQLVAMGLDTREIARELCYSERTVKGTLHSVTARMQLKNRAHAVAFAIRAGYI